MRTFRELPSTKLACIVTYGAMKRVANDGKEMVGVLSINSIPNVGEFDHWNVRGILPVYQQGDKFFDIRTGKQVKLEKNSVQWPLFTGTVLKYPNGQQLLLSRRYNKERSIAVFDVAGEKMSTMTTSLTVKGN